MIRVLLADDHDLVRTGMRRLLDDVSGIEVIAEATTGEEAVNLCREHVPQVVLMDINMPGMGGLAATERIKAELPGVRVIGLSMYEIGHIERRARLAGVDALVSKSAGLSELLKAIFGQAEEPV